MQIEKLEQQILRLSYKYNLSHIGSCMTALPILYGIYVQKGKQDRVVLSCGHAAVAQYVVLENFGRADAEDLIKRSGVHPDRTIHPELHCSTGSLGLGITIALGMAIAEPDKKVYCIISDGECAEGAVYEALMVKEKMRVNNLLVYCNYNGYAANERVSKYQIQKLPGIWLIDNSNHWFIQRYGQEAHYRVLSAKEYKHLIE